MSAQLEPYITIPELAKKGEGKGLNSVLGLTGLTGTVDTIVLRDRTESYRTIQSIQRVGTDLPESVLAFDEMRRVSSLGGSKEEMELKDMKESVYAFFQGLEGPVRETIIDEGVEGNRGIRKKALRKLVSEERGTRTGKGVSGESYLYRTSGFVVSPIYSRPENQTQNNPRFNQNYEANSGFSNPGSYRRF